MLLPARSLADELEEYERGDFTRTRLLAWCAAAWCASLSLFRPVEAAMFGVVAFICVYRLPATARVWRAALWTPAGMLVVLYLVLTAVITALDPARVEWSELLPKRMFFIPLLLLPVLPRWRLLLAGLAVGAALGALVSFGRALYHWAGQPEFRIEITDGSAWTLTVGVVFGFSALLGSQRLLQIVGVLGGAAILAMQSTMTQRAPVFGALVGLVVLGALAVQRLRFRGRIAVAVLIPLAVIGTIALSFLSGGAANKSLREAFGVGDRATAPTVVLPDYEAMSAFSSSRLELWRVTALAVPDRFWFGHGRYAWRADIDGVIDAMPSPTPSSERIRRAREVKYAHNTPLDVLYESGIVGLGLLAAAFTVGLVGAFRRMHAEPLAIVAVAALVGTLASAQFDHVFQRSIQGAVLCTLAVMVLFPRPSSSAWSRAGLGAQDDGIDHWARSSNADGKKIRSRV